MKNPFEDLEQLPELSHYQIAINKQLNLFISRGANFKDSIESMLDQSISALDMCSEDDPDYSIPFDTEEERQEVIRGHYIEIKYIHFLYELKTNKKLSDAYQV